MEYITLDKGSVQRFGIKDANGNDTGEYIEFDPEDIELAFRADECQYSHQKNINELQEKLKEIEKACSKEGNFPTEYDNAKRETCKEFMQKEEKTIDDFIGEGTTKKLLNGRKPYLLMFNDIIDMLTQIIPSLQDTSKQMIKSIKEKYNKNKEENNVL